MFYDPKAWPPPSGGYEPPPGPPPRINAAQERTLLRLLGTLLVVVFLGPFAGSSLVLALMAVWRAVQGAMG